MNETTTNQPLNSGVFPDVQRAVRDRLASFSDFGGIALIMQYEGSIDSRIEEALAVMKEGCRPGAALLIATPAAEEAGPNLPTVRLDPFGVTVSAIEDTVFNAPPEGTGRRALEWAALALRALKGWTPPGCQKPLTGWGAALSLGPQSGNRVVVNLTLRTRVDLPPLRQPGEHGYTDTVPPPARI
ncbi:MAG TPA: hypothetical protein PLY53_15745 [Planctomycetota bacterium]|nr:hypothetical protein [Planctomycetota bacterium]